MALKLLLAGCTKADRERLEPMIQGIFAGRPREESWVVSLVRIGDRWSVTLDGPDARLRGVTFMSGDESLRDGLKDALRRGGFLSGGPGPPPARAPAAAPSPPPIFSTPASSPHASAAAPPPRPSPVHRPGASGEMRDRIQCEKCGGAFVVVYDLQPDEPLESVPVACPHCWHLNSTMVGQWAATGKEYRAEKVDG